MPKLSLSCTRTYCKYSSPQSPTGCGAEEAGVKPTIFSKLVDTSKHTTFKNDTWCDKEEAVLPHERLFQH